MAHRDPNAIVTAVDHPGAIAAAQNTADSIELGERFETIGAYPEDAELPDDHFDLVLLAQRISCLGTDAATQMLRRAIAATRIGGRVAVIDLFRGPAKPSMAETLEALRLELNTQAGHVRSLEEIQQMMTGLGLRAVEFAFIEASKANFGVAVGTK